MILANLAKLLLKLIGWKQLDKIILDTITNYPQCVLVYPHTSNWDLFIMMIYAISANHERRKDLAILAKPQLFRYFDLRKYGFIPAARLEDRNTGTLQKIKDVLSNKSFLFLISPKGQRIFGEWKKGYYHIAKEFNCPIIPIGLNYEKHCVEIGREYFPYPEDKEENVREFLQGEMKSMIQLNPECCEFKTKDYKPIDVGILPIDHLCIYSSMIAIFGFYSKYALIPSTFFTFAIIRRMMN